MIPGPSQQEATMHPQDVPATQAIRVRPDAGPTQPPSSTPRTGLFEGQVWRYELSARGGLALGVLGLDLEPAQTGEVLELAVYPEMALDDDGVPDRASTRLGLVERGRPGTVLLDQEGHDLTVPARDLAAHLAAPSSGTCGGWTWRPWPAATWAAWRSSRRRTTARAGSSCAVGSCPRATTAQPAWWTWWTPAVGATRGSASRAATPSRPPACRTA